jgi:L-lactate permease
MTIDRQQGLRAGLVMLAALAPAFLLLALTLPKSFFEDWGWLAGPAVWIVCALIAGRVCRLPLERVAAAAVIAGIPSGLLVLVGLHDLGPIISLPLFGLLCGHIPKAS